MGKQECLRPSKNMGDGKTQLLFLGDLIDRGEDSRRVL